MAKPMRLKCTEQELTPNVCEEVSMFIGGLLRLLEVAILGSGPGAQAVHKGKCTTKCKRIPG